MQERVNEVYEKSLLLILDNSGVVINLSIALVLRFTYVKMLILGKSRPHFLSFPTKTRKLRKLQKFRFPTKTRKLRKLQKFRFCEKTQNK
jgi:hypothetical protein